MLTTRTVALSYFLMGGIVSGCGGGGSGSGGDEQPFNVTVPLSLAESTLADEDYANCYDELGELTARVYLFEGSPQRLDDIDGQLPEPMSVIAAKSHQADTYLFELNITEPGSYRAAITCDAVSDNPETDDELTFLFPHNLRISETAINDVREDLALPEQHLESENFCFECHTVSGNYDLSRVNHDFVSKTCEDCHSSTK